MPAGEQLDVHNITAGDDQAGELSAEQVAGYIAKYATKATETFGSGLDRRLGVDDLEHLDQLPALWPSSSEPAGSWVAALSRSRAGCGRGRTCWGSGALVDQEPPLLHHLHHPAPGRLAFAKRRRPRDGVPLDAWGRPEDDDQVVTIASWVFIGAGFETEGERWLALSAAARAREQRRVAWEELTTRPDPLHGSRTTRRPLELDALLTVEQAAERLARACGSCAGWSRSADRLRQARTPCAHRCRRPGGVHRPRGAGRTRSSAG